MTTSDKLTHRQLCLKAAKYLRYQGIVPFNRCQYVVCELERVGECPDAFGFGWGATQLIEVKMSRADFLSDKHKYWRRNPEFGLGKFRSYLCPKGVIKVEDLPYRWGLLYIDNDGKIIPQIAPSPQQASSDEEMRLAISILRREGITPRVFNYKKYKNE